MRGHKFVDGVWIAPASRAFTLLDSKNPADHQTAKRLIEYCRLASVCDSTGDKPGLARLRERFAGVV